MSTWDELAALWLVPPRRRDCPGRCECNWDRVDIVLALDCSGIVSVMGKSTWQLTFLKVRPTAAKRLICSVRMDGAEVGWSRRSHHANWGRLPLLAKAPMAVPLLAVPLGAPHADLAGAGTASAAAGAAFAAAARAAALRVVGPALSIVGPLLSVGDAGASPAASSSSSSTSSAQNGRLAKVGEGLLEAGVAAESCSGSCSASAFLALGSASFLALASASSRSSRAFWHTSLIGVGALQEFRSQELRKHALRDVVPSVDASAAAAVALAIRR